jgi:hypothetical protein
MRRSVVSVGGVAIALAVVSSSLTANAAVADPPLGLTSYGRVVWNLDALLHDSQFQIVRPMRPPKPIIGVAGWEVPLTIRHAYVSCGGGRWLFEHGGNGPPNWLLVCLR